MPNSLSCSVPPASRENQLCIWSTLHEGVGWGALGLKGKASREKAAILSQERPLPSTLRLTGSSGKRVNRKSVSLRTACCMHTQQMCPFSFALCTSDLPMCKPQHSPSRSAFTGLPSSVSLCHICPKACISLSAVQSCVIFTGGPCSSHLHNQKQWDSQQSLWLPLKVRQGPCSNSVFLCALDFLFWYPASCQPTV